MIKITVLSLVFIINQVFVMNKISNIENSDKLIEKFLKPKARKLFKTKKLKSKNCLSFKN